MGVFDPAGFDYSFYSCCIRCLQKGKMKPVFSPDLCSHCYSLERLLQSGKICEKCFEKGKVKAVYRKSKRKVKKQQCRSCYTREYEKKRLKNISKLADEKLCTQCIQKGK